MVILHIVIVQLIESYMNDLVVCLVFAVGTQLVLCAIKAMMEDNCDDVRSVTN